jgi:hypothetical protein
MGLYARKEVEVQPLDSRPWAWALGGVTTGWGGVGLWSLDDLTIVEAFWAPVKWPVQCMIELRLSKLLRVRLMRGHGSVLWCSYIRCI